MATLKVCDVCNSEGKITPSRWRSGYKGYNRIDLCEAHKEWIREQGIKNAQQFAEASLKLLIAGKNQ